MVSLQTMLYRHRHRLSDTIQVNRRLIKILKAKKILTPADLVHLNNCKALGNTTAAHELLRILASRKDDVKLHNLVEIFSREKQNAVVKILAEFEDVKVDEDNGSWRFRFCGRRWRCRRYYDPPTRSRVPYRPPGRISQQLAPEATKWLAPVFEHKLREKLCSGRHDEIFVDPEEEGDQEDELLQQQYAPEAFPLPHINAKYYYDRKYVLGTGRTSKVFLGYRDNDPDLKVAVKWVFKNHCTVSPEELDIGKQIWRELGNPASANVVPVYDWSMDNKAYFIVMELAVTNLYKAICEHRALIKEWDGDCPNKSHNILRDCVSGLQWLHGHNVVHNELRPQNILMFRYENEKDKAVRVVAKIADFGISRRVLNVPLQCLPLWTTEVEPWMSPELATALNGGKSCVGTQQMDIYSLGAIYELCLKEDRPWKPTSPTSKNLLKWMMNTEPQFRPTISQVREHPVFWNEEKCLTFLEDLSRGFSNKKRIDCQPIRKEINDCYKVYHRNCFHQELDWMPLVKNSGLLEKKSGTRNKNYDTELIMSLVELIRDKAEHYQEMNPEVQTAIFNNSPYNRKDYVSYFLERFPYIVINLFCKLASVVNVHKCMAAFKEQYFISFLDMDHRKCWREDENISTLLNSRPD